MTVWIRPPATNWHDPTTPSPAFLTQIVALQDTLFDRHRSLKAISHKYIGALTTQLESLSKQAAKWQGWFERET